jgi:hypothetical protein
LILISFAPETIGIAPISISFPELLIGLSWNFNDHPQITQNTRISLSKRANHLDRSKVNLRDQRNL